MKRCLLPIAACFLFFLQSYSQSNRAYAIVSHDINKAGWMNIQEIDLSTGEVIRTVFEKGMTSFTLVDGVTKKVIDQGKLLAEGRAKLLNSNALAVTSAVNSMAQSKTTAGQLNHKTPGFNLPQAPTKSRVSFEARKQAMAYSYYNSPTASMVAAAAFDVNHNRLYFTPIGFGELRWINLNDRDKSLKVYCLTNQAFSVIDTADEGYNFTRMVIAADGNGYALSNDARSLIRFTTGNKPAITKLGEIYENEKNPAQSIHNKANWGGDMVADALDNLYVITSTHTVFKINTKTKSSTYLGTIEGLPKNYTSNGAAIDKNGNLVVSSANSPQGYYRVDLASLKAEKQPAYNQPFSCSDLASSNLAFSRSGEPAKLPTEKFDFAVPAQSVTVFPNPVKQSNVYVSFKNIGFGQYTLQLVDLEGRTLSQKRVNVSVPGQTENLALSSKLAKGAYFVKILNGSSKIIQTEKIISQ